MKTSASLKVITMFAVRCSSVLTVPANKSTFRVISAFYFSVFSQLCVNLFSCTSVCFFFNYFIFSLGFTSPTSVFYTRSLPKNHSLTDTSRLAIALHPKHAPLPVFLCVFLDILCVCFPSVLTRLSLLLSLCAKSVNV